MKPTLTHARFLPAFLALTFVVFGCATPPAFDYTAFIQAKPTSLLVLPPLNDSPDIKATPGVWAHTTQPLAEAGYYVLPITLVDETFRQNGMNTATEIHDVPPQKLYEFFGADAVVYLRVKKYGTSYTVLASHTTVEVDARIVDLRSGIPLWHGTARASSSEHQQQNQGGLIGLLVAAIVEQVVATTMDATFKYAGIANQRLLGAPRVNGLLPGPRSPFYGQPPVTTR